MLMKMPRGSMVPVIPARGSERDEVEDGGGDVLVVSVAPPVPGHLGDRVTCSTTPSTSSLRRYYMYKKSPCIR
jgi:hypothetical protein